MSDPESTPARQRSLPRRLLNRMEVDRAVFFSVLGRAWQFLAGPVTAYLIAANLTAVSQGFYYAFLPLLAMQAFVELGLHTLTVITASHEWAHLSLAADGGITGDATARSKLIQIGRQVFGWFIWMSVVFTVAILPIGLWFLSKKDPGDISWRGPWIVTAVLTGLSLAFQPAFSLLEGCQQVAEVHRVRLYQVIVGNLAVWLALVLGGGLWALPVSAGVRLIFEAALVLVVRSRFFATFRETPAAQVTDWKSEHWPLQWRIAVQSVFGYLNQWIFTLLVFEIYGAADGGRMGMTWSILTALQSAAAAWVQTRSSLLGSLAAKREDSEFDRVLRRVGSISFAVIVVGGVLLTGVVAVLKGLHSAGPDVRGSFPSVVLRIADVLAPRVLDAGPTAVFCLALALQNLCMSLATGVRAYKVDPYLVANVVSSSLTAIVVWQLTARLGIPGAAWGMLIGIGLITLPWNFLIWRQFRRGRPARP